MSKAAYRYLSLLIIFQQVPSLVFASKMAQDLSNEQLTRMLNEDWGSYAWFEKALFFQQIPLNNGYLLIDDSVLEKHYSGCNSELTY